MIKASVLTIDQCQGHESDAVILSLVRRPTRFLNLNRLNVARVRKRLYIYLVTFKIFKMLVVRIKIGIVQIL